MTRKYLSRLLLLAVLLYASVAASAREQYAQLPVYVKKSTAIVVCTVVEDRGDGSVRVQVKDTLKGRVAPEITLSGETGICRSRGPVSLFMRPDKEYLVFLFAGNKVGRLGGILEVRDSDRLIIQFMDGFKNTVVNRRNRTLPLDEAKRQIQALLSPPKAAIQKPR
jgi:hypothetical protein